VKFKWEDAVHWAALLTVLVSIIVATASGVWAVFVRAQGNRRLEWKRIEELIQILHNGAITGLWAQKLAIDELVTIRRRRREIRTALRDASSFFRDMGPAGASLAQHIDDKLNLARFRGAPSVLTPPPPPL
jgi:hypothetical protein